MPKPQTAKPLLLIAAMALVVAGCGVRGPLDPPNQATGTIPNKSPEAGDAGENSAAKPKPHEEFILDSLLR
jgi:predicted small lipoprotein YifL